MANARTHTRNSNGNHRPMTEDQPITRGQSVTSGNSAGRRVEVEVR